MAAAIFISYRRDDSEHAVARIERRLAEGFGSEHVFRDTTNLLAGADVAEGVREAASSCRVMLVVLGDRWDGTRLHDARDWVRIELCLAKAKGTKVIPVLLPGARLPHPEELPDALRWLADRIAHPLSRDPSFLPTVDALGDVLSQHLTLRFRRGGPNDLSLPSPAPVETLAPGPTAALTLSLAPTSPPAPVTAPASTLEAGQTASGHPPLVPQIGRRRMWQVGAALVLLGLPAATGLYIWDAGRLPSAGTWSCRVGTERRQCRIAGGGAQRVLFVVRGDQEHYEGALVRTGAYAASAELTHHVRDVKFQETDSVELTGSIGGRTWSGSWRGGFGQPQETQQFELWR